MTRLQALAARLAPILEFLGALIAALSAIIAQVSGGHPLNAVTIIAAVVGALGHATSHTTGTRVA